jgi:hypothetical protein
MAFISAHQVLYERVKCATCGRIPGDISAAFSYCSLCRDPAAGRFCCKDPCFRDFWTKGHRDTCAGWDRASAGGKKETQG